MRLGVHISVSAGPRRTVEEAVARGCEAIQVFSSNPRAWALSDPTNAELARLLRSKDIGPVLVHTPYLVNPAAADPEIHARSVACIVHAAQRARQLGGAVVVHAGQDRRGPRETSVARAALALRTALKLVPGVRILVEPTAGGPGAVATRLPQAAELLEAVGDERLGLCLDTCHLHAAGYDLRRARSLLAEVHSTVGLERVGAWHLNDSRDPRGSGRDRHWHLGQGRIGEAAFRALLSDPRLRDAVLILETPGTREDDVANLARARAWAAGRRARTPATGVPGEREPSGLRG